MARNSRRRSHIAGLNHCRHPARSVTNRSNEWRSLRWAFSCSTIASPFSARSFSDITIYRYQLNGTTGWSVRTSTEPSPSRSLCPRRIMCNTPHTDPSVHNNAAAAPARKAAVAALSHGKGWDSGSADGA